jgi:flagellar hook-associated protein 1 FlgK
MSGSLNAITNTAASGLAAVTASIGVISENVSNAGVASYTSKTQNLSTFEVGNQVDGVRTGLVTRSVNAALQASVFTSAGSVGGLTIQSQVLQAVNATQGTPGAGTSLADYVSALQTAFTTLQAQPSATAQQSAVVQAATTLANSINSTASTITTQENSVQSQIVTTVATMNSALSTIQSTTQAIMAATATGQSTSDLEDQRDAALQTLSGAIGVTYDKQADGNITILGQGGFSIPLSATFSTSSAILNPQSASTAAGGSVPPVLMQTGNPADPPINVTNQLSGGQLGALVQLRDTTLPGYTASLDSFSANLATQFSGVGLQLFTDGNSTTAISGSSVGLSSAIQVNAAVTATPSLVVNGTPTNLNTNNDAGYTGVIDNVLNSTFSATGSTLSLATQAGNFVAQQSADTSQAGTDLTNATAYQTTVASALSNGSAVDVDQQMGLMIQLQNSYQANAQVITTTSTLFTALLNIFVQSA